MSCATFAGRQAVSQIQTDQHSSSNNSGLIWLIVLAALFGVVLMTSFRARGRRSALAADLNDLRRAAGNTLSQADDAVQAVETGTAGKPLQGEARAEYDRALALRDTAQSELERGTTPEMLWQANQDAAQSVMALQGVMRRAGIQVPAGNPLQVPTGHRCFYCGRDDRPPYTTRTIEDGHGNSMTIEVCAVDEQRLEAGERPQVATVPYGGGQVPWYAVPGNPWYYTYGGSMWQSWLPFVLGMEAGQLFGGGWGWGGGWGYGMGNQGGTIDIPSDAGGAGFGGWGDAGGWDAGGGGWGGGDLGGGGGWS